MPSVSGTKNKIMDSATTIFWFRRDLRIEDNAGLYFALKENDDVLPLFIFDKEILGKLENTKDKRVAFIHHALEQLKNSLEALGSSLWVVHDHPLDFFKSIVPKAVYTNHDYEPYARERDDQVSTMLEAKGIIFKSFKDQVIFEKDEIVKDDGKPYTVFTPFSKKWKSKIAPSDYKSVPVEKYHSRLRKLHPLAFPSIMDLGFQEAKTQFPERKISMSIIQNYHERRNFPGIEGTSRLSVHLRFGTVSIRRLVSIAVQKNEVWLSELIWREFYQMILWHFPNVECALKPAYDRIIWRNDPAEFEAWRAGKTGYPIVDAGMRELNETGFMHNRVRMIAASFLVKHLLIDWRWGEAYFAAKLLDFDLAANNGGWQWAAGSGCDAAPYFRVFNPYIQTKKFDPDLTYIKKWVPDYDSAEYPPPIVAHQFARNRVLKAYTDALDKSTFS